jgi:AraC family transcriptional regulator
MTRVKLARRKPTKIAYLEHRGPYQDIPWDTSIEKLYAFAKKHKLRPGFRPMGIYPDDPATTAPAQCRTEVAIPVKGEANGEGDVRVRLLAGSQVAVRKFEGTSADYEQAYKEIGEWVKANGYERNGDPLEVYTKKPKVVGGQTRLFSRIEMPVRRR